MEYCQFSLKRIERSDSTILGILDHLGHFRHFFIKLYRHVQEGAEVKPDMTK